MCTLLTLKWSLQLSSTVVATWSQRKLIARKINMESLSPEKKPPQEKKRNSNKLLLRYAGLAFQMMATLGLAVFVGYKIDQRTGWGIAAFIIIFSLLGLHLIFCQ